MNLRRLVATAAQVRKQLPVQGLGQASRTRWVRAERAGGPEQGHWLLGSEPEDREDRSTVDTLGSWGEGRDSRRSRTPGLGGAVQCGS